MFENAHSGSIAFCTGIVLHSSISCVGYTYRDVPQDDCSASKKTGGINAWGVGKPSSSATPHQAAAASLCISFLS